LKHWRNHCQLGHNPLRPGTFDHMPERGAFRRIGRGGVDAVDMAVLIGALRKPM
jgi:hypothetical protein